MTLMELPWPDVSNAELSTGNLPVHVKNESKENHGKAQDSPVSWGQKLWSCQRFE